MTQTATIHQETDLAQAASALIAAKLLSGVRSRRLETLLDPVDPVAFQPRRAWLAHCQGKLIGVALVSDPETEGRSPPVLSVFVEPSRRHCGLGRAMVGRALRDYPQLMADPEAPATGLYRHMGVSEGAAESPMASLSEDEMRCLFVQKRLAYSTGHRRRP